MFDIGSPIKVEITLGMLQDHNVTEALGILIKAMGKAQESINAKIEQEMRDNPHSKFPLPPFPRQ